jgi:signal transduction histidine kinase
MKKPLGSRLSHFFAKLRIFIPILLIIVFSVFLITYYSVFISRRNLYDLVENYLQIEVKSLKKMFEREFELKLENAKKDMRVIDSFFYQKEFRISDEKTPLSVQEPGSGQAETILVKKWYLGPQPLHNNHEFVDKIKQTVGSKATIFQKTEKGFVRISTNVMDDRNNRAVGTLIPFDSAIAKAIQRGQNYFGRAFVINDWFVTGYGPIFHQGELVGMLFVGTKEKDLPELSRKFKELNIGQSGYPIVFDKEGRMVIDHHQDLHDWTGLDVIQTMIAQKKGVIRFLSPVDGRRKIVAFDFFPEFELYIAAVVNKTDEAQQLIRHLIIGSVLVSLVIILLLSIVVYFLTVEKLHRYLQALESRNQELATARDALRQSEKLATMGQLSAGIAHEVNNPLGVVLMYSHILMEECDPSSQFYKDLETIATQANRCKTILSGLLNFARKNEVNKKFLRLDRLFESIQESLVIPSTVGFAIEHHRPDLEISVDEGQMTQVFVNLVNNSIDAIKANGEITIKTMADEHFAYFQVEDNGPGIAEEFRKRLFEPFSSTKEMGKGTGLGLAVCYGIVKMHSGTIKVESCADPSQGQTFTRFVIALPKGEKGKEHAAN